MGLELSAPTSDNMEEQLMEWFASRYYKLHYSHRTQQEALAFACRLAEHYGWHPPQTIVDAGCGRGRLTRALLSLGFRVVACDAVPSLVEEVWASVSAEQRARLVTLVCDIREHICDGCGDHLINFFASFGYWRTRQESGSAIGAFARAVRPGGLVVIDYLNVQWAIAVMRREEVQVRGGIRFEIQRWHDEHFIYKRVVVQDGELRREFTERLQILELEDFEEMFVGAGLRLVDVWGSYELERFEVNHSPRLIVVGQKPAAHNGTG